MAVKPFNSIDGFSVSSNGNVIIDAAGNITTDSIIIAQYANLGNIANVKIGGGTNGYVISTDGTGNLSFIAQSGSNTSITSPMPTLINLGETYYVTANHQGLYSVPIEINGALEVDGVLVQVDGINFTNITNQSVFFNDNDTVAGSSNLTFNKTTSTLTANNFDVTSSANLGSVSNITITGGTSGYVLSTNGSGGLSWVAQTGGGGGGTPGGSNTQVQYNDSGSFAGSAAFVFNNTSNTLTAFKITATSNITAGNANLGNLATANFFSGDGSSLSSITGANVTGAVSYATTANAVAGGNVSGQVSFAATANSVAGGNVSGAVGLAAYATSANSVAGGNVSGQVANALVSGTVYTNAQPNITSTGTLASLSVTANANIGNVNTANLVATGSGSFGANVNMNSYWINNVGYPALANDVATKSYVDTQVSTGITYHEPVSVATTTTLATATGGTTTYNSPNGAANGIGAYISTTGTFLNIDGSNVQTVGTRILVKNEANATWHGIYTYANTTAIVRSTDADEYGPDSTQQLSINDYFFVQTGSTFAGTSFIVSAPNGPIIFGTSNIAFSVFSSSQVYTGGTGIAVTGTVISANASQTQITAVGTLTSLSVSGNANIGNISTAIVTATGNITGANLVTGGVISVTGNANVGNIGTAIITATGNITGANLTTGILSATGNVAFSGANVSLGAVANLKITGGANTNILSTDGAGNVSWIAQPDVLSPFLLMGA